MLRVTPKLKKEIASVGRDLGLTPAEVARFACYRLVHQAPAEEPLGLFREVAAMREWDKDAE